MENYLETVKKARMGAIIPIIKIVEGPINPTELFAKISNYGRKKNSLLFESADTATKYGEISILAASPCLRVMGYKENFEVTALSSIGRQFLKFIKNDFGFCDSVKYTQEQITGKLVPKRKAVDEAQRLRLKNHSDIIRQIAFKFKPLSYSRIPYSEI